MSVVTLIFVACKFTRLCRPLKGGPDVHMYTSAKLPALADAFRQIRPGLRAAGALSIFINLLVFVSPLYTMQVYDRVLTSRNAMTLLLLSLIALALFVSYAALEHFRSRVLVQTGIRFDQLVSGEAFETALGQSLRTSSSHHVQLLRDVDTLREVLSRGVITSLMDVPSDLSRDVFPAASADRLGRSHRRAGHPRACLSQRTRHQSAADRGLIEKSSCLGPVDLLASQRGSDPRAWNGTCRARDVGRHAWPGAR